MRKWNRSVSGFGDPERAAKLQKKLDIQYPEEKYWFHINVVGAQHNDTVTVHLWSDEAGIDKKASANRADFIGAVLSTIDKMIEDPRYSQR